MPANTARSYLLPLAVGLAAGFGAGWFVLTATRPQEPELQRLRPSKLNYQFINPLIGFDYSGRKEFREFTSLSKHLNDSIGKAVDAGRAGVVSVYFRELTNGHWVGINEDREYQPGSLFKVVVMMALYKKAESEPAILEHRITYTGSEGSETDRRSTRLAVGRAYSVGELIDEMIIRSDNVAKDLLGPVLDEKYLTEVFGDLDIPIPDQASYGISARTYSLFFRVLYNASFLNRAMSERALSLLNRVAYTDGLIAGLPPGTAVAHKYGQSELVNAGRVARIELHDCGIVYAYQSNPYFLCVMTQGNTRTNLQSVITDISRIAYEEARRLASP